MPMIASIKMVFANDLIAASFAVWTLAAATMVKGARAQKKMQTQQPHYFRSALVDLLGCAEKTTWKKLLSCGS